MSDKLKKIDDELTLLFINYQNRLDNPMLLEFESNVDLAERYRSDFMFNAKVRNLVNGVMRVVIDHAD